MADLQNIVVTPAGSVNVNVPKVTISCQVTDSQTGVVLADFTGANALSWPGVLSTLTAAQHLKLLDTLKTMLILMKAGLA